MRDVLLSMTSLSATFNHSIRALTDVSLTVRRGEIVALLGANGAGKSTALKAAARLLPAERGQVTGGEIRFDGCNVAAESPGRLVRRGLASVLEGRHCFRSLTVEDNLVTGALGRGARRGEIAADLDRVYALFPPLAERRRSLAGLTSGGEQQMTAIGRALMSRPVLLLLDEPSMGLAPQLVETIFRALKRLNSESGLTLLVAEQNSTVALRFADRAFVLENGHTKLSGDAQELRRRSDVEALYLGGRVAAAPAPIAAALTLTV